ncbi:MAG TPA: hypothetical protein VF790_06095 [Dissulfurispiraceae bacterium]
MSAPVRGERRFDHVTIGLKYDESSNSINALSWNEKGFNFFLDSELHERNLSFKKGKYRFQATIIWSYKCDDKAFITETALNKLLFDCLDRYTLNSDLKLRIVALCRTMGRIPEKQKLLNALGVELSDERISCLIKEYPHGRPMYRYGVKVESQEAWTAIVRQSLDISAPVISLDSIGKALHGIG